MNKEQLFKAAGLSGTFDSEIPQTAYDEIAKVLRFADFDGVVSINPIELFVWWYPDREDKAYSLCGRMMPVARMYALAIQRGELIPVAEKRALIKNLMGGVDRDTVLNDELEAMAQQEAHNASH